MAGPFLKNLLFSLIGRGRRMRTLIVYYFVQRCVLNVLLIVSTTLFLKEVGVQHFPTMYIILNLLSIAIQFATASKASFSSYGLLHKVSQVTIALLGACALVLSVEGRVDAATFKTIVPATIFGFLIASRMFDIFSSALFFNVVYELYPIREAKEKVPALLTTGSLGTILTGFAVKPLLDVVSIPVVIASSAIILFVDYLLLRRIGALLKVVGSWSRTQRPAQGADDQAAEETATRVAGDQETEAKRSRRVKTADGAQRKQNLWTVLEASPLLRTAAAVTVVVSFLKFQLDYQYSQMLSHQFPDKDDLASFLGMYESVLTMVIIGAQVFLTAPAFVHFKVGVVCSFLPMAMVGFSLIDCFWTTFWPMAATKFVFSIFSNAFYQPSGTIVLGPLKPEIRERGRMVFTAATSLGCLTVGFALNLGLKTVDAVTYCALMAAVSFVGWVLTRRLDGHYQETLSENLSALDVSRRLESVRALRVISSRHAADWILELIEDADPEVRVRAIGEVKFLPQDEARRVLEKILREGQDERLKSLAVKEITKILGPGAIDLVLPYLAHPEVRMRANAVEALVATGEKDALVHLRPLLESEHHRLVAASLVGILTLAEESSDIDPAVDRLCRLIRAEDPMARASAAWAMGRLGFPFFLEPLLALARDGDEMVALKAVEALESLHDPSAVQPLSDLATLRTGPLAERIRETCERIEDVNASNLIDVMENLSAEERSRLLETMREIRHSVRAQVLREALSLKSPEQREAIFSYLHRATHARAPELVQACLAGGSPSILPCLEAMRSGTYRGEGAISRLIRGFLDEENVKHLQAYLREVYERVRATLVLSQGLEEYSLEWAALGDRRRRLLGHAFVMVSLQSEDPQETVELLEKALEGDRFVSSMSYELLGQQLAPGVIQELVPLLDDLREPQNMKSLPSNAAVDAERDLLEKVLDDPSWQDPAAAEPAENVQEMMS